MGTRAEALAQRIEEGARNLASFAEGLNESGVEHRGEAGRPTRGRHHPPRRQRLPIEMHLASEIAAGKTVTGVTWAVVADMNAKHAQDNAGAGKAETVALLRQASMDAAAAVRAFTDAQLDSAAPFSLNADAPLTSQFVIEDHALRHSWHHLAKIKAALGRG